MATDPRAATTPRRGLWSVDSARWTPCLSIQAHCQLHLTLKITGYHTHSPCMVTGTPQRQRDMSPRCMHWHGTPAFTRSEHTSHAASGSPPAINITSGGATVLCPREALECSLIIREQKRLTKRRPGTAARFEHPRRRRGPRSRASRASLPRGPAAAKLQRHRERLRARPPGPPPWRLHPTASGAGRGVLG